MPANKQRLKSGRVHECVRLSVFVNACIMIVKEKDTCLHIFRSSAAANTAVENPGTGAPLLFLSERAEGLLPSATSPSRIWKAVDLHVMAAFHWLSIVWENMLWFEVPVTE